MNNNKLSLSYKDTDKKIGINIYGLEFEIKPEIETIDTNNIKNMEEIIDKILGDGAYKKINEQRIKDGYEEINSQIGLTIISACVNAYVDESIKPMENMIDNAKNKSNKINNFNRWQRKNYNRNYRGNRYRRY